MGWIYNMKQADLSGRGTDYTGFCGMSPRPLWGSTHLFPQELPLATESCLTKSFPQGQTTSSDWSVQGYKDSTPLPPFATPLQNSLQAGGSYYCNSITVWVLLLSSPTSLCYSINCLQPNSQISLSPRVPHLWQLRIQLDIILSFILYMLKWSTTCWVFFFFLSSGLKFVIQVTEAKARKQNYYFFPSNDSGSWVMITSLLRKLTITLSSFNFILCSGFFFTTNIS